MSLRHLLVWLNDGVSSLATSTSQAFHYSWLEEKRGQPL
ncbi:hypothetical protein SLEP1_g38096 [Rubroshorea leprosula]|uniref:Uncharacterized protein n=1 Tax=Rubroshorea leprosula TaxID=152421 RepID=A0AAV5KXD0_9ROSI|nr:hypothetical protein SLEP1_g38096 [Rubroshorea leprosula]